jgi:hypothetical protein
MANKYSVLFNYFRQCPQLADLWSIAATQEEGVKVILPQGARPAVQYEESFDNLGNYECNIIPYASIYEDYQINCYESYDQNDSSSPAYNLNVLSFEEVQKVCDWVKEQNRIGNFPDIGESVVAIECNPFVPQISGITVDEKTICYYITIRIRYVNWEEARTIYVEH